MRELHANPIMDPYVRANGFWTYLHIKDAARACRMAIEAQWQGHERFFLNAKDTMIGIPTAEAIARVFPTVPLRKKFEGFETTIDISKAKRFFGWEPIYSWRDQQFAA